MKQVGELFGVIPGHASRLKEAGVCTIFDLATTTDLQHLSGQSGVPVDLLGEWQAKATLELATTRRRRTLATIFAAVIFIIAGFLFGVAAFRLTSGTKPHQVNFSWSAPPEKTGLTVASYNVYRATRSSGFFQRVANVIGRTSYADSEVESHHTYDYFVTAVDHEGREGPPSSRIEVVIP